MTMRLTSALCLMTALAFGILTPLFAQEAPNKSDAPDQQASLHWLMEAFVRTINTSEVSYRSYHGNYASWPTLLEDKDQHEYLNDWLARFYPEFYPNAVKIPAFSTSPEPLPGVHIRLIVASDGQSYLRLLEDGVDKIEYALVSDERGIIKECKPSWDKNPSQ